MSVKEEKKRKIAIAISVLAVVTLLVLLVFSGGNGTLLKNIFKQDVSNEELKDQLAEFGWRGYIAIIALATLQIVCTFLPAEPIQVLSGITFSYPVGLLCCMVGVVCGSTLIFMLQKTFDDRLRSVFLKKMNLDVEKIARSSKMTVIVLLLYFMPVLPYGVVCFLAAAIGMSYRKYIVVTVMGTLPSVCIGVGLGYMALASGWHVTLCVAAVLVLVVAVLIYKKDALFAKMNRYAEDHQGNGKNKVQPVNVFVMTVLYYVIRFYLFLCGVRIKAVNKVGRPESPSIILCNHGSFIDFIYASVLLRKFKPHFVVARLYFYHNILGYLLRKVGAFPKSMFALDMESTKNCLTVLRNKEILAMMPEARLSTTGRFEDIQPTTYSFLQKSGVNIYTLKINGAYLADPKWGKGFRRGATVEAELDILYTAEQVKSLSVAEIQQGVENRLSYHEFQWLRQRPNIHYRSKHIAEGLENILITCPKCGQKYTLTTKGNEICCSHCGHLTSVNDRYGFADGFTFADLTQWYDWQKALLEKEISENEAYTLSSQVELRLPGDGSSLTRHGGYGTCTLSRDGLTYSGTKDGETVELHFSIQRIYRILFGAGENFEIYDGTQILYFVPEEKRSAIAWYMASILLYEEASE